MTPGDCLLQRATHFPETWDERRKVRRDLTHLFGWLGEAILVVALEMAITWHCPQWGLENLLKIVTHGDAFFWTFCYLSVSRELAFGFLWLKIWRAWNKQEKGVGWRLGTSKMYRSLTAEHVPIIWLFRKKQDGFCCCLLTCGLLVARKKESRPGRQKQKASLYIKPYRPYA